MCLGISFLILTHHPLIESEASSAEVQTLQSVFRAERSIETIIREELGEVFVDIARCESELSQYYPDGSVVISQTSDVGLFQINQVHWQEAIRLGIDIYTLEGNIEYAKILKARRGTKDWYMSEHCWNT